MRPGFAAGALIGSAAAAGPYGYGYGYGAVCLWRRYGYGYGYDDGPVCVRGYTRYTAAAAATTNICAQRYRSYDPSSGTFLGYDGMRHPCP